MHLSYIVVMAKRTALIAFRVTAGMKAELERLAEADRRSLSSYIELALERHVAEVTKPVRPKEPAK